MVFSNHRARTAMLAVPLALGATLLATSMAYAATTNDDRALAFDGNVTTCDDERFYGELEGGLEGVKLDPDEFTYDINGPEGDQLLHITAIPDGVIVTGIVVKGGPGYNVYEPDKRGMEQLAWNDLRSPLTGEPKNIPEISHWFACGIEADTPPSSTVPPTTTTEPPSTTTTEPPSSTEPPASTEPPSMTTTDDSTPPETTETKPAEHEETTSPASTTTTAAAVDTDESDDELALTGFGAGWMIPIGALLIFGGGAALWLARARRA